MSTESANLSRSPGGENVQERTVTDWQQSDGTYQILEAAKPEAWISAANPVEIER